jgi:hypothetical protein
VEAVAAAKQLTTERERVGMLLKPKFTQVVKVVELSLKNLQQVEEISEQIIGMQLLHRKHLRKKCVKF